MTAIERIDQRIWRLEDRLDELRAADVADVAAYLRAHPGASDEDVSGAVTLPVWNVRRCREGLGRAAA
ncbi:MAG: hypothetical protein K2V38_05490 [Gemmataceae bacterium]|nr:hypothetical protein [Gemmataceae bacterium]